jgi:hypothetical protein
MQGHEVLWQQIGYAELRGAGEHITGNAAIPIAGLAGPGWRLSK